MISVLAAASSPVTRAGLKALVEQSSECRVVGVAHSSDWAERAAELHPDVVLWQLAGDEDAALPLHSLPGQRVVLIGAAGTAELLRTGARGVLAAGSSETQIAAAIHAAAENLVVFSPGHLPERAASGLSAREIQVLRMIAEGLANKEIAWKLGISEHTVKFHVSAVLGKLGVASRAEAVGAGVRQGIIML